MRMALPPCVLRVRVTTPSALGYLLWSYWQLRIRLAAHVLPNNAKHADNDGIHNATLIGLERRDPSPCR